MVLLLKIALVGNLALSVLTLLYLQARKTPSMDSVDSSGDEE